MRTFWDSVMTLLVHVAQGFSWGTIAHRHFPFLTFLFLFPLPPSLSSLSFYFFPSFPPRIFPPLPFPSLPFPSQKADVDGRASVTEGEEAQSNSHLFQAIMHHSYMTEKQMQSVIAGRIKR